MSYIVKEIFYTLQGEGANTGRPAVLVRFSGCNLWSGWEADRAGAICQFCDTDFVGSAGPGGGRFATATDLTAAAAAHWPEKGSLQRPFVVLTGGEPLLQLDDELVAALHQQGFEIAVETNGTRLPPEGIDWLCVSPKGGAPLLVASGQELKLVFPQQGADPRHYQELAFAHFFLQPLDGPDRERHTRLAIRYCLEHPQWRLSLQTQKYLGIP